MKEQYIFPTEQGELAVRVIQSRRKTASLEVKRTGEVIARVPLFLTVREMKEFVEGHLGWVLKKLAEVKTSSNCDIPEPDELTQEQWQQILSLFARRISYYAEQMQVTYGRVTIRNQKTRWGSCSSKGNLNFNYRLAFLQPELLDYVVVHELAHRRHMNHSEQFWQEVARYCPDYRSCRKRLKQVAIF